MSPLQVDGLIKGREKRHADEEDAVDVWQLVDDAGLQFNS